MGTTFQHIQLYTSEIQDISEYLTKDEISGRIAHEWLGLFPADHNFTAAKKRAKKLSTQLHVFAMHTYLFDEDVLEIRVYDKRAIKCVFRSSEGQKALIKPTVWQEIFELDKEEMQAMRLMLKTAQSIAEDLAILEAILGTRLWIDRRWYVEEKAEFVPGGKDKAQVASFLEKQRKLQKIGNKTKLSMVVQKVGMLTESFVRDEKLIISMVLTGDDGNYDYRRVHCFTMEAEELKEFYEYSFSESVFPQGSKMMSFYKFPDGKLQLFAHESDIMLLNDSIVPGEPFEKELYKDYYEWLRLDPGYIPKVYQYAHEDGHAVLNKMGADQEVTAQCNLNLYAEQFNAGSMEPIVTPQYVLCFGHMRPRLKEPGVLVFDHKLNFVRRTNMDGNMGMYQFYYLETGNSVYFQDLAFKNMAVYRLETDTFEQKLLGCGGYFLGEDARHNLIVKEGNSTILLIDKKIDIISRHRLKGMIRNVLAAKTGEIYVLTADQFCFEEKPKGTSPMVRIYKIAFPG